MKRKLSSKYYSYLEQLAHQSNQKRQKPDTQSQIAHSQLTSLSLTFQDNHDISPQKFDY